MTRNHLITLFANGEILAKQAEYKFRRGKIVRGSFYDYYIGNMKITEAQFDYLRNNFNYEKIDSGSLSRDEYKKLNP